MTIILYDSRGDKRLEIAPSAGDRCTHELLGIGQIALSFTSHAYTEVEVGDYVDYLGVRYYALVSYMPEMVSTIEYRYSLTLYDEAGHLQHAKVQKPAQQTIELSFSYDARPHEHVQLIVDNLNRLSATKRWSVGTVIDAPSRNIEYNNRFCLEALGEIASTFATEWWIEGTTINLCRCEWGEAIPLGYRAGLATGLTRTDNSSARHFTRLYPLGSSRNIDRTKYGSSRLTMPGGKAYLERNTHLGIIEQSQETAFAEIYPRYTGRISSVRTETRKDKEQTFEVYYFKDDGMAFNPSDYEIAGLVKHIVFTSGELNGRDFEANYHASKGEWELITQFPYDNQAIPSGRLIPKVGDAYIPYNIRMPQEYIDEAERELERAAMAYLERISEDTSIYKATTDYIDIQAREITLKLGQRVTLYDSRYFAREGGRRTSRITRLSRNVLYPTEVELEFAHTIDVGKIKSLEQGVSDMRAAYRTIESTMPAVLHSWDSTAPSEHNILSAARTIRTIQRAALSKDYDDSTAHSLSSTTYAPGLSGWRISPQGEAEFTALKVSGVLEVDEFRRNRITILEGEHFFSSGAATVLELGDGRFRPTANEGIETTSLIAGDYCIGKWMRADGTVEVCQLKVERTDQEGWVHYSLALGSTPPREGMHIAQMGHTSDKRRQRATFVRNNVIVQYQGVDGWAILPRHITALYGDLDGYNQPPFGPLKGSGVYIRNAYISGQLSVQSDDGAEYRIPTPRGEWVDPTTAQPWDEYTHAGRRWRWEGATATTSTPSIEAGWVDLGATAHALEEAIDETKLYIEYSQDGNSWHKQGESTDRYVRQRVGEKGVWSGPIRIAAEDSIIVQVWSERGIQFFDRNISTTLYAFVYKGAKEISQTLPPNAFRWQRLSANAEHDVIWTERHASAGRSLIITPDDLERSATFSVQILDIRQ